MHVFIVSRGIPTQDNHLSGIFEWDQAKALHEEGIKVTFIVLDLRSIRRKRKLSTQIFNKEGINVVYGSVPMGNIPAPIFYILGCLKLRNLLRVAIDKFGLTDIIHGHFTDIGAMAAHEGKRLGIPCIVTEHSSSLNLDIISSRTKFFANKAYNESSGVISVGERLKYRLKQHFGADSVVIPNVVDIHSIKFNNAQRVANKKITFVSTGSLLPIKGHDLLLEAFARIPKNKANLIIIGKGPERNNLENQIKRLGLQSCVKLVGFKNRNDISDIYSKADCFVLASRRETFGVVYIEAMLAGLPVIATRCGGPEDFVNEDNGLLVEADNIAGLSKTLENMINSYEKYSPEVIHQNVLKQFSPSAIAKKLIDYYKKVI